MRWKFGRQCENIIDLLKLPGSKRLKGGAIGGVLIVLVAIYFWVNQGTVLDDSSDPDQQQSYTFQPDNLSDREKELTDFISVVLADTEDIWKKIFSEKGGRYRKPKLVLFRTEVQSSCDAAGASTGPFYCPADQTVYIDLSFFQELKDRLDAPGDFSQAYVIAHEIGHHVQKLIGITAKAQEARQLMSKKESNRVSVKLELQADCYAGIWANHADKVRNIIEPGDIEEALNAASRIGDNRLQQQAKEGYVVPDPFTHGSSAQRIRWFRTGHKTGSLEDCDTFSAIQL